jgi:Kdo2-lipid IVA lauroyltransferase/acyltransferase
MSRVFYPIIYALLWLITLLPLKVLYGVSDLLFLVIYYVVPYRKRVVRRNLENSFPHKSPEEIEQIAHRFYRYFTDFFIETVKSLNFPYHKHIRRFVFKNIEVLDQQYHQGRNVVLVSGHYGNWEWVNTIPKQMKHRFYYAARILKSSVSDRLINQLRQKHGCNLIPMEATYRKILGQVKQGEKLAIWLLADQRPPRRADYWTTFLNQDTAFFLGAARFVKKMDFTMVFMDIQRIKRGHYEVSFDVLSEGPTAMSDHELTELHVRKLESIINNRPEFWLWTHKRWKYKKPADAEKQ